MERPHLERALDLARRALARAPAGLITDLDGTLAPIVADPSAARALPGAAPALAALARRIALVALVTGRAAADARRILGSDDLLVIGNHGLERLEPGAAVARWAPGTQDVTATLEAALHDLPLEPGVTVERKGRSATIHLRNAANPGVAAGRVRRALATADLPGISVRAGRLSLELRPDRAGDKGTALADLVRDHGLRGLVVLGDDVTDLDMFRAAERLRREAGLQAAILAVAGGREVPREVGDAADATLPGPEAVVRLLRELSPR